MGVCIGVWGVGGCGGRSGGMGCFFQNLRYPISFFSTDAWTACALLNIFCSDFGQFPMQYGSNYLAPCNIYSSNSFGELWLQRIQK